MTEVNQAVSVASLSVKTLGLGKKELRAMTENTDQMVHVAKIGGVVAESFSGTDKRGEVWTGFKGIFFMEGYNGKRYRSTTAFLPSTITKKLLERLGNGEAEIEFAADISVTKNDKSGTDYAYICEPIQSKEAELAANKIADRLFNGSNNLLAAPVEEKSAAKAGAKKNAA